ncbi:MAG: polysaccharide biosynthesis protein [Clostridia bacterium]|nr:polysaccharide biosynthesis protein [Clostridia bacterium]
MFLLDAILLVAAIALAILFRFENGFSGTEASSNFLSYLPVHVAVYLPVLLLGGLYKVYWKYAGLPEITRTFILCAFAGFLTYLANIVFTIGYSRSVLAMTSVLVAVAIVASRISPRAIGYLQRRYKHSKRNDDYKRIMIIGAGNGGAYVINLCKKKMYSNYIPVLIIDDDPTKSGYRLENIPIMGSRADIPALAEKYKINEIVITIASSAIRDMDELVRLCKQTNCRIRILSGMHGIDAPDADEKFLIRELDIADFLMRSEEHFDLSAVSAYLSGKTILITGGGGSIGSELCRQVMRSSPKKLIIFDIYENNAYELECELKHNYNGALNVEVVIGSIRDRKRLNEVFAKYKPDVVFHAAAHKHVPLMERSYGEAIKNNVFGTRNLLEVAETFGVERFVMLSTDKAVNPTNIMGTTKRINEMMVQVFAKTSNMKCMMVRFGNVLGSHGSVIPLYEMQIKKGGPVTVTHPDIVRYFMTIPEAAQLVLQAGSFAQSGAIYALDMGQPIRIMDLAEKMIRFYGYEPNVDMPIKVTGLRPGEKLYEEVISEEEYKRLVPTMHKKMFVVPTAEIDAKWFYQQLTFLEREIENGFSESDARKLVIQVMLQELVPSYAPNNKFSSKQSHELKLVKQAIAAKGT